jgi:hypothetical protein
MKSGVSKPKMYKQKPYKQKPYKSEPSKPKRPRNWEKKRTLIAVTHETKKQLNEYGKFRETYDDIVKRLIDFWNEHH